MRDSGSSSFYRRLTLGFLMFLSLWLLTAVLMPAQTAQSPPGTAPARTAIDTQPVQFAADSLRQTVLTVNVDHWKAPKEVKSVAQDDISSIINDLTAVLPGLLRTAQASPASFKPAFEVYRNVNALYDVVLRVSQAAAFTGASDDAASLQAVLGNLAKARNNLSNSLAAASEQRDVELAQLRMKVQPQSGTNGQSTGPKRVVVDDGPQKSSRKSKITKPNQSQQ
jgi:hypothetical protein